MKSRTTRTVFFIILAFFIISLIPLYIIGFYAHPSVDDYYYGAETVKVWNDTHSVGAVISRSFEEMLVTYNDWQGNFSAIFLMRLQPGIFGEQYYFIAPLILISTFAACSIFFFYTVFKKIFRTDAYRAGIIALSVTFVSMQLTATPSDSFYWYNGSIYYTFFYSLMLLLFALIIRLRTCSAPACAVLTAASGVLAFLIGGSNYATALFMCIILSLTAGAAAYCVILKKNTVIRGYHAPAYIVIAIAAMAGLFISMAAPGNAIRQSSVGGSTGIVKTFVYTFAFGGYSIARVLNAPCLVFFICMIPVFYAIAKRTHFNYRYPLLVLVFTFGLYCSMGTPVFYAQGLRMPYRMMNIIFFAAYSFICFNLIYFLGWVAKKYGESDIVKTVTNLFGGIKKDGRRIYIALAICICSFVTACVGSIEVGETEYKSGDAGFSNLPLSAAAMLSLIDGDARIYDAELTERDEYIRSTDDNEQFVTVPALSKRPDPIFHSDITDDPGDWHNAHLAMYYRKECIWIE